MPIYLVLGTIPEREDLKNSFFGCYGIEDSKVIHYTIRDDEKDREFRVPTYAGKEMGEINSNEKLKDWLIDKNNYYTDKSLEVIQSELNIGQVYKSLWRPIFTYRYIILWSQPSFYQFEPKKLEIPLFELEDYIQDFNRINILKDLLEDIFLNIAPHRSNITTYGDKVRNLLILACTEVESLCSDILKRNNYQTNEGRYWNMLDYFKIAFPSKLWQYKFAFKNYPHLGKFQPYKKWERSNFKELPWYAAYNQTKHNRAENFEKATLNNAVSAFCGVVSIFIAKYGPHHPLFDKIHNYLDIQLPDWKFSELYLLAKGSGDTKESREEIDYPFYT